MAGIGNYKKIKLKEYTVTQDGNGDNIESLANSYAIWAEVIEKGGARSFNQGVETTKTKTFKIYFKPDWVLTGNWTVKYFGREYTLENIERINEKRFNWILTANG